MPPLPSTVSSPAPVPITLPPAEPVTEIDCAELKAEMAPDLLGGVVVVKGEARTTPETNWDRALYRAAPLGSPTPFKAKCIASLAVSAFVFDPP